MYITYIQRARGFVYLAVVLDYTRRTKGLLMGLTRRGWS
jgi:hypothetical protein